jgi:hypothetical protein
MQINGSSIAGGSSDHVTMIFNGNSNTEGLGNCGNIDDQVSTGVSSSWYEAAHTTQASPPPAPWHFGGFANVAS